MGEKTKKILKLIMILVIIPGIITVGSMIFKDKQYAFISVAVAILAIIPFFMSFEQRKDNGKLLVIVAVMVAMSSVGRIIFAVVPGFKPVTAIVVLTALYFGAETGFVTGALAAVISNFYFGQGPWTPFQMFAWGIIGFGAGLLSKVLLKSKPLLAVYAIFSAFAYSLLMDIWSAVWVGDESSFISRYITAVAAALPWIAIYAASNVVFLAILTKPVGQILDRLNYKYGLMSKSK